MSYHKGIFLDAQRCPYCHGQLVKRKDYLVCRYHKWAFPIVNDKIVDYRRNATIKGVLDNEQLS